MTDMTDDQVRALLDGATPGPWRADGEPWNRIVWSSADNRVCFMAHSSGLNDARDTATSNLVAAAPDLARALLDARAELADAEATQAALRAEIDRLTRWRAEEGEKIKRQAKALTDLTKHCQRIEAENAGLARKIGKVQRGDGDHSQIADLEAKVINQRNELANLRARDGRLAELAADRYRLAAANAAVGTGGDRRAHRLVLILLAEHEILDAFEDHLLSSSWGSRPIGWRPLGPPGRLELARASGRRPGGPMVSK